MIVWSSSIDICRPPEVVFELLANIQDVQQAGDSTVLALDLITQSPPRLGSQQREVVQMMPFIKGEIFSEITAFDPPRVLEMTCRVAGMTGTYRYELAAIQNGATLSHMKCVSWSGDLRLMEPIMQICLIPRLEQRLVAIKRILEIAENRQPVSFVEMR